MPTTKPRINLAPERSTYFWAMRAAFQERRSMSALAVIALEDYLKRHHADLNTELVNEDIKINGFIQ